MGDNPRNITKLSKLVKIRLPEQAPFDESEREALGSVLSGLSGTQRRWLREYLAAGGSEEVVEPPAPVYGKRNPFPAKLVEKVLLSGKGTAKEAWHLEFSLEGSGMDYEVGDALAVVPQNAADVVESVLAATGLNGAEEVTLKDGTCLSVREACTSRLDITGLTRSVAKKYLELTGSAKLAELLDDGDKVLFREYAAGRQVVDLLEDFPMKGKSAADLVGVLRSLPPRLYSIASSPKAHPGEVHLTVAGVRYDAHGKSRKGVASTCLADMVRPGQAIPVFVQPNKRFRLPEDDTAPIIMVGPGTGVAPYRAFVEERAARGATGESWLIFGDQHFLYDYLYQLEWQAHLKSGALTRIDVAFSRDQPEKVYVQHRLREQAEEVFSWLEKGACFYVCGDATHMAGEIHETILEILEAEGGRSREDAEAYVEDMKLNGRYQLDIY